jgi:hypothetical protein
MNNNFHLLDEITEASTEIQHALKEHLQATSNPQYKADIEIDLVTLNNLKQIMVAVKSDLERDNVGACTELLLRIAANDFKNKLKMIPEKKAKRKQIIDNMGELHKNILKHAVHGGQG